MLQECGFRHTSASCGNLRQSRRRVAPPTHRRAPVSGLPDEHTDRAPPGETGRHGNQATLDVAGSEVGGVPGAGIRLQTDNRPVERRIQNPLEKARIGLHRYLQPRPGVTERRFAPVYERARCVGNEVGEDMVVGVPGQ